jgi:ABC-type Mn2+/Zn2+ transport system permease subunit
MQPQLLFASPFLLAVVLGMLLAYLGLAIRYWFRLPLGGVVIALICASAAVVVSRVE